LKTAASLEQTLLRQQHKNNSGITNDEVGWRLVCGPFPWTLDIQKKQGKRAGTGTHPYTTSSLGAKQ
jgi:hypothetical protein